MENIVWEYGYVEHRMGVWMCRMYYERMGIWYVELEYVECELGMKYVEWEFSLVPLDAVSFTSSALSQNI